MKKLYFTLMLIFVASGCAPLRPVVQVEDKEAKNNITVFRNNNYIQSGYHFWPTVHDKEVAGLLPKEYVSFYLPQGATELGVSCFGGLWPTWWHHKITVTIEHNENYYFLISPYALGCANIEIIDAEQANERKAISKQIKTGFMSDCAGNSIKVDKDWSGLCLW